MKITFLGTGTSQGVPVIACPCEVCQSMDFKDKRFRSSLLIETGSTSFVIDTGPDFRAQMLRERVRKLDAVLFTHEHKDHVAGLDDVRSFNFLQRKPMPVYARKSVIDQLKREFSYAFSENKYPGVPSIDTHEIFNVPFSIGGLRIIPIEVYHFKLPVFGFRINDLVYITDANYIPEEEWEKIIGCKVLIVNALQYENHISHFNVEEAIKVAQRAGAEKTYFTHISHKMGKHKIENAKLPEGIEMAFDGLKFEL